MFIYTMCRAYFAISTLKKVSKRHFTCRFYLSTIAPALRYLKTLSPDGMPISPAVRYRFAVPVLPTRTSHLLSLLPHAFPPRRLPPRFSRRFPVCQHPYRFPTCLRRRPSLPCSCHQIEHAHLYRLRLPYRLWSPHRLTPYQMPYRMSVPAGHRGSGYPILIWRHGKWAGCSMRVETPIGCDIEHAGISHFPPKTILCDFDPFAAGRIICLGWVWPSRAYWNHGRGIAHGDSARLRG